MKKQIRDFIGKVTYQGDELGTYIWANRTDGTREIIGVVYGYNTDIEKNEGKAVAELFQDKLGEFIAEAINEKIKRETTYSDLLRNVELKDYDNLSVRLLNCLYSSNIRYITDLCNYTRSEIYSIKKFGRKTQWELDELMKEFGVEFKGK